MNDTVGDEDVSDGDASAVDKDATLLADGNREVLAIEGGKDGAIHDIRRVADSAVDYMVGQYVGDIRIGEVGKSRANVLESLAGRREDSDIGCGVDSLEEVCRVQSTAERGKVGSCKGIRNDFRKGEESVNDMNHTTSEVNVLERIRI